MQACAAQRERLHAAKSSLVAFLRAAAHRPVAVALAGGFAAVLLAHSGPIGQAIGLAYCLAAAAASLFEPRLGLHSVFPLLYAVPPVPATLGPAEISFASLVLAVAFGSLRLPGAIEAVTRRRFLTSATCCGAFVVMNLVVALLNGVTLGEWVRGLAPFAFLAFAVPAWLILRERTPTILDLTSLAVTAALFASRIVYIYIDGRLWRTSFYSLVEGNWLRLEPHELVDHPIDSIYELMFRVTLLCPAATDVLIPLGIVWGFGAAVFSTRLTFRRAGACLATLNLSAALFTQTRSMLLTTGVVLAGLCAAALYSSSLFRRRAAKQAIWLFALSTGLILGCGMQSIYFDRLSGLIGSVQKLLVSEKAATKHEPTKPKLPRPTGSFVVSDLPPTKEEAKEDKRPADVNVTTRFDEYLIGLKMFRESPLVGKGLGVKHTMRFAVGSAEDADTNFIEQRVGYVHNWVVYWLMTGGLIGTTLYIAAVGLPLVRLMRLPREHRWLIVATLATAAIYGLFFAVFRLLPFNLLLGLLSGWTFAVPRSVAVADNCDDGPTLLKFVPRCTGRSATEHRRAAA